MTPLSAWLIVFHAGAHLAGALESVAFCDEVVVLQTGNCAPYLDPCWRW